MATFLSQKGALCRKTLKRGLIGRLFRNSGSLLLDCSAFDDYLNRFQFLGEKRTCSCSAGIRDRHLVKCTVELVQLRDVDKFDSYENMGIASYLILDEGSKKWVSMEYTKCLVENCGSWTGTEL